MNPKFSTLFSVFFIMAAALGLYGVKYKVEAVHERVMATAQELKDARESQHVLEAEWAYLNRAERLEALASKYLKLAPMQGVQMADLGTLPQRGVMMADSKTLTGVMPASLVTTAPPRAR